MSFNYLPLRFYCCHVLTLMENLQDAHFLFKQSFVSAPENHFTLLLQIIIYIPAPIGSNDKCKLLYIYKVV